jgi:hypothetical protein
LSGYQGRHKQRDLDTQLPHPRESKLLVKPLELAVMLYHIHKAANDPDIGFIDAERRLVQISNDLVRKPAAIKQSLVESSLAFCNMMAEQGKFWHPFNKSIDEFISDVVKTTGKPYRFDKDYHLFFNTTESR